MSKLVDIIFLKYADEIEKGNVRLQDDGNGPFISHWDVPNVVKPSQQQIQQWIDEEGPQLELNKRVKYFTTYLQKVIDNKAKEKGYNDGNSCVSYKNSTIEQWANEARTFLVWRDQVWAYAINILDTTPNISDEQFLSNLPNFDWNNI